MKVLVTGGSGQLGSELRRAAPNDIQLWAPPRARLDLCGLEGIAEAVAGGHPELIINAAAYNRVDGAEEDQAGAFAVNSTAVRGLAEVAARHECRLIHLSTDFVFSGESGRPYQPDDEPAPLSVYGRSKREGELCVLEASAERNLVLRTSWLYSRFGDSFVKTILRLTEEGEPLEVVADQVGSPTCAAGLARAIWEVARRPWMAGVYHWTDAGVASRYDLAVAVEEEARALGLIGRRVPIRPIRTDRRSAKAVRPAYSVLDCTATWQELDAEPLHWRAALRAMLGGLRDPADE